jgi:hypothetical protein
VRGITTMSFLAGKSTLYAASTTSKRVSLFSYPQFVLTHTFLFSGQSDPNALDEKQVSCLSWWPLPEAWSTSSLNLGWWSPLCEEWYQGRLRFVHAGTPELMTHAKWKHNLKLERKVPPYKEGIEKCSVKILSVLCPSRR